MDKSLVRRTTQAGACAAVPGDKQRTPLSSSRRPGLRLNTRVDNYRAVGAKQACGYLSTIYVCCMISADVLLCRSNLGHISDMGTGAAFSINERSYGGNSAYHTTLNAFILIEFAFA